VPPSRSSATCLSDVRTSWLAGSFPLARFAWAVISLSRGQVSRTESFDPNDLSQDPFTSSCQNHSISDAVCDLRQCTRAGLL
jgi:hypothetical protein